MISQVSNLETSAWQRWPIVRPSSGVECKYCSSNAIWLVIVERGKLYDTISFVKLFYPALFLRVIFEIFFAENYRSKNNALTKITVTELMRGHNFL